MSAQDTRAPFRQQRWVECKNVGSVTLAPYAAAEITGATQPDSATTTSVAMARTVLEVKEPTQCCIDNIVIIGPKEIPANGYGVCTNDYPCYALVNLTDTIAEGTIVGVEATSQLLTTDTTGWIVLGDVGAPSSAGRKARVMRVSGGDRWYIGKVVTSNISPNSTGYAEEHEYAWSATGREYDVYNPHDMTLDVGLKVRWTNTYPGWKDKWVVEPWDFYDCDESSTTPTPTSTPTTTPTPTSPP